MMYRVEFDRQPMKIVDKWKKSNPPLFKKLREVINDIAEHPRMGIGHPEPLVGGDDLVYSRHITAKDRIIYKIYDDTIKVLILQVENHYNDK